MWQQFLNSVLLEQSRPVGMSRDCSHMASLGMLIKWPILQHRGNLDCGSQSSRAKDE